MAEPFKPIDPNWRDRVSGGQLVRGRGTIRDYPALSRYMRDYSTEEGRKKDPYRDIPEEDEEQRMLLQALMADMIFRGGGAAPQPSPTPVPTPGSTFSNITNPQTKDSFT